MWREKTKFCLITNLSPCFTIYGLIRPKLQSITFYVTNPEIGHFLSCTTFYDLCMILPTYYCPFYFHNFRTLAKLHFCFDFWPFIVLYSSLWFFKSRNWHFYCLMEFYGILIINYYLFYPFYLFFLSYLPFMAIVMFCPPAMAIFYFHNLFS